MGASGSDSRSGFLFEDKLAGSLDLFHTLDVGAVSIIEEGTPVGIAGIMTKTAVLSGDSEI